MAFAVPFNLAFFLIVAGLAILAASFRIAGLARRYRQRMENLLQLASKPIDPLDLPAAAWPDLQAGGWQRLAWEGSWFGQPVTGFLQLANPKTRKPPIEPLVFELVSGDEVRLTVRLTHADAWGENRLFAEHLARVFVLLLETRLHARTEALSAALAERARLSLYLQHDMRNQAQWVLWVADDFAACEAPDALLSAAKRLRDNAPLAHDRAERLIAALGRQPQVEQPALVDLRTAAGQAARLAGVEPTIMGAASAWIAPGLLARAFDNLFGNLAASWREQASTGARLTLAMIDTARGAQAEMEFFCPWPKGVAQLPAEKIFEPFASGRPSGLGLGLYQARKSLREAAGDLQARPSDEGLRFVLSLPGQSP